MVDNPLLEPALFGEPGASRHRQNSVVAAIDIATFSDVERYRDHVDRLVDGLKALPRAGGVSGSETAAGPRPGGDQAPRNGLTARTVP